MTTVERMTAVGVFEERARAEQALDALHQAGFTDKQIGFVVRGHNASREETEGGEVNRPSTTAGAVSGGFVGGVIGALTSLLIPGLGPVIAGGIWAVTVGGVALGALAGGLAGSLAKMGVPEEEARYYQEQLQGGRAIVTVDADGRYQEAVSILCQAGASSYNVHNDMLNSSGTSNMVGELSSDATNIASSTFTPSTDEDIEDMPTVPLENQITENRVATREEDPEPHPGLVESPIFPSAVGPVSGPVAPMSPSDVEQLAGEPTTEDNDAATEARYADNRYVESRRMVDESADEAESTPPAEQRRETI